MNGQSWRSRWFKNLDDSDQVFDCATEDGSEILVSTSTNYPVVLAMADPHKSDVITLALSPGDARRAAAHLLNLADDADGLVRLNFIDPEEPTQTAS